MENNIMMLYPPVSELVEKIGSRYQLVNLVARRARVISSEAEEKGIPLYHDEQAARLCHNALG